MLFSVGFAAFLTFSRNSWLGLFVSLLITLCKKRIAIVLLISTLILIFLLSPIFHIELLSSIRNLLPQKILMEFSEEGYVGLDTTRLEIFKSAILLIKSNPIFGIGAASFPEIFNLQTGFWKVIQSPF